MKKNIRGKRKVLFTKNNFWKIYLKLQKKLRLKLQKDRKTIKAKVLL
jgi:hypothetical protein